MNINILYTLSTLLMNDIFLFLLIGLIAGACSGLLGIGGGTILVPIFLYTLPHYLPDTFLKQYLHHTAVATSIACIFLTACISGISHLIKKFTPEKNLYFLAAGSLLGAYINTRYLFLHISGRWIHFLFIIFLWLNIYFLFKKNKSDAFEKIKADANSNLSKNIKAKSLFYFKNKSTTTNAAYQQLFFYFLAGCAIATIASTIGLGGGFIVVPLLLRLGFGIHLAIASSIINGIALAIGSLLAYYQLSFILDFSSMAINSNINNVLGFIYLPALLIIAPIACISAFFSTRLAYRIPQLLLKRIFAIFLLCVSILLLIK